MRFVRTLIVSAAAALVAGGAFAQEQAREVPPSVVRMVKAEYTQEAKDARIQGTALLEAVVKTDGSVGDVTVVRSVDKTYGLDEEAIKAVKQWIFKPGTKDGKAVQVAVQVEITFALK